MKIIELQQRFQSIHDKLAGLVNYNEIEFVQLGELVNEYLIISNDYARVKGEVIDVHQKNIVFKALILSLEDKKLFIRYRREVFKTIKNLLNNNITIFTNNLADGRVID
jgi:hypothetical protein